MKKIFGMIFLMLCFCVVDKVEAVSCLYRSESHDVEFAYYTQAADINDRYMYLTTVKNLDKLDLGFGKNYDIYETWDHTKIEIIDAVDSNKCYKYMYFDAVAVLSDTIYFSDSDSINKSFDIKLELVGPYKDSSENAILNEMVCTYSYLNNISGYPTLADTRLPYFNYTFKIKDNGNGSGSYELYGDYTKLYENNYKDYTLGLVTTEIEDQFSIRNFWEENTGTYMCPPAIFVSGKNEGFIFQNKSVVLGYNKGNSNLEEYLNTSWWGNDTDYNLVYYLSEGASYIDYQASDANQGQICNYTRKGEGGSNGNVYISLAQYTPTNMSPYYVAFLNERLGFNNDDRYIYFNDIPENVILESCKDLPVIYTDCLNVPDGANCSISQTQFSRKDNSGKELVEQLVEDEYSNSQDVKDALKGLGSYTGYQYKTLICELKDRLDELPNKNLLSKIEPLKFYSFDGTKFDTISIDKINCDGWLVETNFSCDGECKKQIDYLTEKKIREITSYCQVKYSNFDALDLKNSAYKGRMEECISFQSFYSSLVANGIVRDLSNSCKILSDDLVDKLVWVLDIIKIAGPILAVGLGTLDFVKVVASGDADKEMKSAFKRFGTRIIAAVLLFLVPVILAFLMDTFLGNQSGYDSDNPFCDIVEFNE